MSTLAVVMDRTSPPALGRRERNKLEKRERIIAAATDLFEQNGFEDTTTAAIAEAAGIGAGTLYLYVSSKEDLLVAVFREDVGRAWSEAFAKVDPTAPIIDQLLAAFGHVTDYHEHDPALARAYFKELLFVSGPVREGVTEFMRGFYRQLTGLLADAQDRGLLDPDVPVRRLSSSLFALWYVLMQRRHTRLLSRAGLRERIEADFRLALWGMT